MLRYQTKSDGLPRQSYGRCAKASLWPAAVSLAAGLAFGTNMQAAHAESPQTEPFKVANVHFETNASACDMGAQIRFDTEGIVRGSVEDPKGHKISSFEASGGMKAVGGQTEGFLEVVEPQIPELVSALGCEPSTEEGVLALDKLFEEWPAGDYTFEGKSSSKGVMLRSEATLTHHIPAGPEVTAPADATVFSAGAVVVIDWNAVTEPILPDLGPVTIVGYHVIVEEDTGAEVTPTVDVDVHADVTSLTVPPEFLKPATVYRFEVLSTEEGGNQTITEGFFCTEGVAECAVID
jgi:hypothetical protein